MTAQLCKTYITILVAPSRQTFCITAEYSSISVFFIGLKKTSLIVPSTLIVNGAKITFEKYYAIAISLFKLLQFFAFFRFLKVFLASNEHARSILIHFVSSFNNRTLGSFLRPNCQSVCMGKSQRSITYSFPKLFLWYAKTTSQLCWTHVFDISLNAKHQCYVSRFKWHLCHLRTFTKDVCCSFLIPFAQPTCWRYFFFVDVMLYAIFSWTLTLCSHQHTMLLFLEFLFRVNSNSTFTRRVYLFAIGNTTTVSFWLS